MIVRPICLLGSSSMAMASLETGPGPLPHALYKVHARLYACQPLSRLPLHSNMLLLIAQGTVLSAISWALWRILRRLVIKSDLDNVLGPVSDSFLKGNSLKLFNLNAWEFHRMIGQDYGGIVRIDAVLGDKFLYVSDPKALHHIIAKDQRIFEETDSFLSWHRILFGDSLLSTLGERHRKQRKMLNPVFSIAHMREMVPIFYEVTHKLGNALESRIKQGLQGTDVLEWFTRTALELICQSGLGYSIDPLTDESAAHPYIAAMKEVGSITSGLSLIRQYLLPTLVKLGSPRFQRLLVNLLPFETTRRLRDAIDIMHNTSVEILRAKKRALQEGDKAVERQIGRGRDIMSILMKANMEASEGDKLTEEEVLGQMGSLIFAATDTTSSALSRIVHLLATHQEVQDKLRQEITGVLCDEGGQDFSYDELVSLPFLDAICRETLRLYPPLSALARTARRDAVLPFSTPITGIDGRVMNEIVVPKDTTLVISIINCNRDPALWGPDSYEWKPERWLSPLPATVSEAPVPGIYFHLMTFLGGGRACIGFKFSQLEMKVVLCLLLSRFRFTPSEKEVVWEMSGITRPTEKGHPGVAKLPLTVTLL